MKHLVRIDEPIHRLLKGEKAAFQPFNQQNLHKFTHVLLGLFLQLVYSAFVIFRQ